MDSFEKLKYLHRGAGKKKSPEGGKNSAGKEGKKKNDTGADSGRDI